MKNINVLILLMVSLLFSGCAVKQAMNANEFRAMTPKSSYGKVKVVKVNRSLKSIAKSFKKRTSKCLDVSYKRTACFGTGLGAKSCNTTIMDYNPKLKTTKKHIELSVQMNMEGAHTASKIPKGGLYTLVVDVTPINRKKSQMKFYYDYFAPESMVTAISGWATGKTKGCPDLSKK